jgi:phosphoglycerol transferase MdoB-like AlkP superfamily enzyme
MWPVSLTIVSRIVVSVLLLTVCRMIFFWVHFSLFQNDSWSDILFAFGHGVRFDLSALFILYVPWTLLNFFPLPSGVKRHWFFRGLGSFFWTFATLVCVVLTLVDIEYYAITGHRLSLVLTKVKTDVIAQLFQFSYNYWPITLCIFVLMGFGFWIHRLEAGYLTNSKNSQLKNPILVSLFLFCVSVVASVFFIRGGTQIKPLRPTHAFQLKNINGELGQLSMSQPFYLIHSRKSGMFPVLDFNIPEATVKKLIERPDALQLDHPFRRERSNVVVFIIESLSAEYMSYYSGKKSYTPFLDEVIRRSFVIEKFFANGRSSIEAVPSVLGGIPSVVGEPFVTSVYQSNRFKGLAHVLNGRGYQSHFFHGAQNGSMFIDSAAHLTGFKNFYGKDEFPMTDPGQYDGTWGIWDHLFFDFISKKLNDFQQPFLAAVFTINPHQPYRIPPAFQGKFQGGPLELLRPLEYIDASLRDFFEKAEKEDWYKNTLFVFTADHTSKNLYPEFSHATGRYHVPLFMFHPQVSHWPKVTKIGQQIDIPHTVLDFLNVPAQELLPYGHSLFDLRDEGLSINGFTSHWGMIGKPYSLLWNQQNSSLLFDFRSDPGFTRVLESGDGNNFATEKAGLETKMKAFLQHFSQGLNKNNWLVR